jgi:hypothetical protein
MSYQLTKTVALGASLAALTLQAQLKDSTGTNSGAPTAVTNAGGGLFTWVGTVPSAFLGWVYFNSTPDGVNRAIISINPADEPAASSAPKNLQVEITDITAGG